MGDVRVRERDDTHVAYPVDPRGTRRTLSQSRRGDADVADVQYAKRDDTHIAFRVLDGPDGHDLVMVSGFNFPLESLPEDPIGARLLDGLSSIGRLAIFDRRGIGLSDPITDWERPLVDQWSDDLATVIDAAGFTRPTIFAWDVVRRRPPVRDPLPRRLRPHGAARTGPVAESRRPVARRVLAGDATDHRRRG